MPQNQIQWDATPDTSAVKQAPNQTSTSNQIQWDASPDTSALTEASANETAKPYSAAYSKFTTPENYQNWLKTAPKAGPNIKPGEYEAWTGAHTPGGAKQTLTDAAKPVIAGAATGAVALGGVAAAEAIPSVLPHTIEGVKAIGAWAKANPLQAWALFQVMKEMLPGAKKALGFIKAMPEERQ
jgi:hypothetical protein